MFKESLLSYTGKGLWIWQRPDELAEYLVWLAKRPPIRSYVEIGVELGGTFIAAIEFLRRFHPLHQAIGVDPWMTKPVKDYVSRTAGVDFVQGTHQSSEFQRRVAMIGTLDLVLIDGDHSHHGVRADWEFAKSRSNLVAFHDVAAGDLPGVTSLWAEICKQHRSIYEFIDDSWQPNRCAGLGIVELKKMRRVANE